MIASWCLLGMLFFICVGMFRDNARRFKELEEEMGRLRALEANAPDPLEAEFDKLEGKVKVEVKALPPPKPVALEPDLPHRASCHKASDGWRCDPYCDVREWKRKRAGL